MAGDKRALSNLGGPTESRGDPAFCVPLVAAMEAQAEEADVLTHGFHAHPARMHPSLAGGLLSAFDPGGAATVLDPFCGSGTVAIEAMRRGWRSLNSDLDPIAIRLARVKTELRGQKSRRRFVQTAERVAAASERRVRDRTQVRARLSKAEREWYDVHVLKEMAGLLEEIRRVGDKPDRRALEMVFSSLVVKFSRQRSETSQRQVAKTIRKGLVTEFFLRKSEELAARWTALRAEVDERTSDPTFVRSDARELPETLGGEFRCDLVLTSPPYGGTYDYAQHHVRRHAWFDMKTTDFERAEIGARRRLGARGGKAGDARAAVRSWDQELEKTLRAVGSLVHSSGLLICVIGDGEVGGRVVAADKQLERLAPHADLEFLAAARQPREGSGENQRRYEHVVALIRP